MNILITGSTGFLGPYLVQEFKELGTVIGVARSGADCICDLTNPAQVAIIMDRYKPEMVVHAAALTDVEKCEKEPALAIVQNGKTTENVVDLAPEGCRIIYISSDMIYSGQGPHREDSKSENPVNMYGMSKYMGEFSTRRRENHLIIRTNMVGFSQSKKKSSLVDFLVNSFKGGGSVSLFTDAMFSPLSVKTLCQYLRAMATTNLTGTFNLGSSTGMSKAKFALMLAHELKIPLYGGRPASSVNPERAFRPLDTRMDVMKIEGRFGFTLPTLKKEIETMCRDHLCVH